MGGVGGGGKGGIGCCNLADEITGLGECVGVELPLDGV
jgi:hypothetical protein